MKRWFLALVGVMVGVFLVPCQVMALTETEIELTATVAATEPVTVTYDYTIVPNSQNQPGATNEPAAVTVEFNGAVPNAGGLAVETAVIDFAGTDYVNTGIYRYTVTEASSSNPAYPATKLAYEIYVRVTEDAGVMKKQVHTQALNLTTGIKEDMEFPHGEQTTYIYVENFADGLITDIGTVFRYKLEILGPLGATYAVRGQDATVNYEGRTITTADTYEVKDGEENYLYVYLKDGQTVTVGLAENGDYQIPVGTKFRLAKDRVNKWHTTINGQDFATEQERMEWLVAGVDPALNKIIVENLRSFDVPLTGVILNALPFLILVGLAMVGISLIKKVSVNEKSRNKKRR